MKYLVFLILFALFQYSLDRYFDPDICETKQGNSILILHHLISAYLLTGFLFNPFYHLLAIIAVFIHWKINRGECIITQATNNQCKWNQNKPFKHIFKYISSDIENYLIITMIFYDIYLIQKL